MNNDTEKNTLTETASDKSDLSKILTLPTLGIDSTIHVSRSVKKGFRLDDPLKEVESYWNKLGPGLTTGAADDDPSGIATYSQAGAQYGFTFLWLATLTYPFMAVVQEMCARIGLVTGKGLAANIKKHYPPWVLYLCTFLLFAANTFNIGADLGAMAQASKLVIPWLSVGGMVVFFTLLSLLLQIFTTYKSYARFLKWLALILFSYVITAFIIHMDWGAAFAHTFIPRFKPSKDSFFLISAILGTTISPYLFFWQTSQEVEEGILRGDITDTSMKQVTKTDIRDMRIDVWSGMFISNMVMFFIIAVCSATLFTHGIVNIGSAADAAAALRPLAGKGAYLLFAFGIIGTGLLAVPILAGSSSYAISESFNWKMGLYKKLKEAYAFYGVIIAAMAVGLILNFIHLDPIKALLYSAVANSLVSPLVLIIIVRMSGNKEIMGERINKSLTTFLGWFITIVMSVAGIATIVSFFIP